MDRAAILTTILQRNALRREARLPPLDVPAEFGCAVEQAHWREIHERHYDRVRDEIVEHLRRTRGRDYQESAGGRGLIAAMTARELRFRFGDSIGGPGTKLGYGPLDAILES